MLIIKSMYGIFNMTKFQLKIKYLEQKKKIINQPKANEQNKAFLIQLVY